MRRLYLRIYLAMLASLAIFAVVAAIGWKLSFDRERASRDERVLVAEVVAAIVPPADAPADVQRAVLERWAARTGADLALFDAQRAPIASAGRPVPPPRTEEGGREGGREGGWRWGARRDAGEDGPPAWSVRLPDGRWAVARPSRFGAGPPVAWGALLLALTLAVAIGAYPVVRRLTRRLERLQQGVDALGSGDLGARVPVQGRDEIAALARSFNRSAERIESLVRSQRSLLANASHELRSPLARLRMATALLSDPEAAPAGEAQRAALREEVERNVAELDALIEEILIASRLDAQAGIANEPVDLLALLAQEAARAGATLTVGADAAGGGPQAPPVPGPHAGTADACGPMTVAGDPRLLRRLVRNLLENARRHGGGTPVDVHARREAGAPAFDVLDRGPGVPEAERERIFEPFHRLAGHGEGAGGVGLGLALVRQIAQRHGARVECLPREGGGTRFAVRFGAPGR